MSDPCGTYMFTSRPVPLSRPSGDLALPVPDGWQLVGNQWGQPFGVCGILKKVDAKEGPMPITLVLKTTCGKTTCAATPGNFCRFVRSKSFGTKGWCLWYDVELFDKNGWLQRCRRCMDEYPVEDQ